MASLGLQAHRRRTGHWIVATGMAKNTCGDHAALFSDNPFAYFNRDESHRPANSRLTPREMIAMELGGCFWADSVVRIENH